MYKLCLGLSLAAVAMLVSCSGDNGSSVSDLVELPDPSEVVIIGSSASGESSSSSSEVADSGIPKVSSSSSSKDAGSSESGGSGSSSSENAGSSESGGSGSSSSENAGSSESGDLSSSSTEESSSSESSSSESEESSSSSEQESSSSEVPESSSEEVSSSSIRSSSSDGSIYDATANTLTDLRDNQVYRTTTIDIPSKSYSEVWMAENMNFETENSWCGGGSGMAEGDCSVYGRLYTWAASVGKTESECGYNHTCEFSGTVRGVCPEGWHLPSYDEWNELFTAVGGSNVAGKVLKSKSGWKSSSVIENTDGYLFTALPAGYRNFDGSFASVGDNAYFWSSMEYNIEEAHYVDLYYSTDYAYLRTYYKDGGISVRCLKD